MTRNCLAVCVQGAGCTVDMQVSWLVWKEIELGHLDIGVLFIDDV